MPFDLFLQILTLLATITLAISGVLQAARSEMDFFGALVLASVVALEETLKWGEPSYLTKGGSTIRIDWKPSSPHEYAVYFNCKSKLVDTFKELYREELIFDGNRAIVLKTSGEIPVNELKHCISLALTYHRVKHLPLLGA